MKTSKSEYVKVPEYIPNKTYNEILDRFMNLLHELDDIYKTTRLKYLERDMVILVIRAVVNSFHEQNLIGENLRRQMITYEINKYFGAEMDRWEIGKLAGSKCTNPRYARNLVYKNLKKINDYIDTRDPKCFGEIMDIDERIERILK